MSKSVRSDFLLEAFVDFPDDACASYPITPAHIDAMMRRLKECGVKRVSWDFYGDGHGGFFIPLHTPRFQNMARNYHLLGNPLKVGVEAAHRHGLEIYGYFKPYETGPAVSFPDGSLEAMAYGRLPQLGGRLSWQDPFVVDHPHLRIRRRSGDLPAPIDKIPVCQLKLIKSNDLPTRIKRENLQIWTSDRNFQYKPAAVHFEMQETTEVADHDVYDIHDNLLTHRGDRIRILTLSGFELRDAFILVTTDFTEGPGDFSNAGPELLMALDKEGKMIPGVFASGDTIWDYQLINFRTWGLMFDHGWGRRVVTLDAPNADGQKGIIAYCRGRNEYLPGALCETEPAVQECWLNYIQEILDAGVDGVDLREENHSTHTEYPGEYGYNQVVLDQCARLGKIDPATIAQVRGKAYTSFLRRAKHLINRRGKKMRIHFQLDYYRPRPATRRLLAYPANLNFEWQTWIEEGLTDQAVLRFYELPFECIYNDEVSKEIIERCRRANIPVTVNRYIQPKTLVQEYKQIYLDGRFSGFILYESACFLGLDPNGGCSYTVPEVSQLSENF